MNALQNRHFTEDHTLPRNCRRAPPTDNNSFHRNTLISHREHYQLITHYLGFSYPSATMDNDFPHFPDGDVLILITSSRRYKLHSAILRRSSPTFAALLDEQTATVLSKNARKKGVTTRFRLHLVDYENAGYREGGVEAPTHVLRRIPLDENGSAVGDYPDLLGDAIENGRVVQQFVLVSWQERPSSRVLSTTDSI